MRRLERKMLRVLDEMGRVREEIRLTEEELNVHRHLDDDARRDAAVGGPIEREDARITGADVARFEEVLSDLRSRLETLEAEHRRLAARLRG
jgi:hypothetical protein